MPQNEDNRFAEHVEFLEAGTNEVAADAGFLQAGISAHRPETGAGGFSIDQDTEEFDMTDDAGFRLRDERGETVPVRLQLADDTALVRPAEGRVTQRRNGVQVFGSGGAGPEVDHVSLVPAASGIPGIKSRASSGLPPGF